MIDARSKSGTPKKMNSAMSTPSSPYPVVNVSPHVPRDADEREAKLDDALVNDERRQNQNENEPVPRDIARDFSKSLHAQARSCHQAL
jgi:hypothetical protein